MFLFHCFYWLLIDCFYRFLANVLLLLFYIFINPKFVNLNKISSKKIIFSYLIIKRISKAYLNKSLNIYNFKHMSLKLTFITFIYSVLLRKEIVCSVILRSIFRRAQNFLKVRQ